MTTPWGSEPHETVDSQESACLYESRTAEPQRALPNEPTADETPSFVDTAVKILADTTYAVVGLAAEAADRARGFYTEQRERAMAEGEESSLSYTAFVTVPDRVARFGDDVAQTIQDLADKGRDRLHRTRQDLDDDLGKSGSQADPTPEPIGGSDGDDAGRAM